MLRTRRGFRLGLHCGGTVTPTIWHQVLLAEASGLGLPLRLLVLHLQVPEARLPSIAASLVL
jgi:hypothetical protein